MCDFTLLFYFEIPSKVYLLFIQYTPKYNRLKTQFLAYYIDVLILYTKCVTKHLPDSLAFTMAGYNAIL